MATVTANQAYSEGFCVNVTVDDLDVAAVDAVAAVTGKSHYIENIYATSATTQSLTIGLTANGASVTTPMIGPVVARSGFHLDLRLRRPVKCTAGAAIAVAGTAAGVTTVTIEGYTA
jgi:hypothetical protein